MYAATGQWDGWDSSRVRNRPATRLVSQDTDLNYGVREKMLGEARALCQTVGICNSITSKYADYVVGSCNVKWDTGDESINEQYEEAWREGMTLIDYNQQHSLPILCRIAVISALRDGDIFFKEIDAAGVYQLQAIEADRVTSGPYYNNDTQDLIGGVRIDKTSRARAYRVWDRNRNGGFVNGRDVPASEMIHIWDTQRFDGVRGVTAFSTALNHLRDWKEILSAEKTAQKAASKLALLVKNAIGAPWLGSKTAFGPDVTTSEGNTVKGEEISDGVIQYLVNGDHMEAFMSNRPSGGFFQLAELLLRDISIGIGLPYEFVWNMAALGGPGVRLMSKQSERVFKRSQQDLEFRFLNRVVMRKTAVDIEHGRLPFNSRWMVFKVQRPAHISIDAGRDSAADMNELEAGATSLEILAEQKGLDAWDILLSKARIAQWAQELSDEYGVPIGMILGGGSVSVNKEPDKSEDDPEKPDDDEDEEDKDKDKEDEDLEPAKQP